MPRLLLIISFLFFIGQAHAQSVLGVDGFLYAGTGDPTLVSPVVHYETKNHWYAEARYNYEDIHTLSVYAGHVFSGEGAVAWSFTPMIGGLVGNLKGGAVGLNSELTYKKFNFSSQAQYVISADSHYDNFFYNWSELSYQPLEWMYAGVAVQRTRVYASDAYLDPGIVLGFSYKQWTFPLYVFRPFTDNSYFVIGVNREIEIPKNKTKKVDLSLQ